MNTKNKFKFRHDSEKENALLTSSKANFTVNVFFVSIDIFFPKS